MVTIAPSLLPFFLKFFISKKAFKYSFFQVVASNKLLCLSHLKYQVVKIICNKFCTQKDTLCTGATSQKYFENYSAHTKYICAYSKQLTTLVFSVRQVNSSSIFLFPAMKHVCWHDNLTKLTAAFIAEMDISISSSSSCSPSFLFSKLSLSSWSWFLKIFSLYNTQSSCYSQYLSMTCLKALVTEKQTRQIHQSMQ